MEGDKHPCDMTLTSYSVKLIPTYLIKNGSGTFRSSVFSLLGAKVPTENFRSRERKFPGTKVLGNCSREQELSFPSKQVRFLTTVIDIYNTQMLGAAVKKVHIFE